MKAAQAGRLETIQALRGVAVLAVVISHALHELAALLAGHLRDFDEKRFPGDFGVDLFFVISGFIMVYVCRDAFARPWAPADYLRRRVIRIVPLYWAMTTLMIAVVVLLPDSVDTATSDPGQWLASYFFIPYQRLSDGMIRPVLGLGWSLQYEMFFYCLFALGLFLPRRFAIPFVSALVFITWFSGHEASAAGTFLKFISHPIIFEFVGGMFLGWAFVSGMRLPKWVCLLAGVSGLVLLFAAPSFDDMVDMSRHLHYGVPSVLILTAAIMFAGSEDFRVGRLPLEAGETSYATYLTHPFVLGGMSLIASRLELVGMSSVGVFSAAYLVIACIVCMVTGYAAHYLLDVPLSRMARRLLPAFPKAQSMARAGTQADARSPSDAARAGQSAS